MVIAGYSFSADKQTATASESFFIAIYPNVEILHGLSSLKPDKHVFQNAAFL